MIYLRVPDKAWATLDETLAMDTQASNFSRTLRDEISQAYDRVNDFTAMYKRLESAAEWALEFCQGRDAASDLGLTQELKAALFAIYSQCTECDAALQGNVVCPQCGHIAVSALPVKGKGKK